MIRTTLTRGFFILLASLFVTTIANAQTGLKSGKNKKSKSQKTEVVKKDEKADKDVEEEAVEYYWGYSVMEVFDNNGAITIKSNRAALNGKVKLSPREMGINNKAAAGGLSFTSEMEFLQFMSNNDYELVSAVNSQGKDGKTIKMYFRIKLER